MIAERGIAASTSPSILLDVLIHSVALAYRYIGAIDSDPMQAPPTAPKCLLYKHCPGPVSPNFNDCYGNGLSNK